MSATAERLRLGLLTAAVALAAACGAPAPSPSTSVPTTTAPVVRTDIVARLRVTGTLTYAGSYVVINQTSGIYTALPTPGTSISRGQTLYRVDGRPIPLLYGGPEWRRLAVGVADGPDVKQLEENLLALGFANRSNLVANGRFDAFDAAAVRRWQASIGVTQSGSVNVGDAAYEPGPIRVAAMNTGVGTFAQPGQPLLQATTLERAVLVQLDVSRQQSVRVHDAVQVTMPDGRDVLATVASIGAVAVEAANPAGTQGAGPPAATVTVTITLSDPSAAGGLDQAPVDVNITSEVHAGVLAVPVMALMAQPGGGYAVEAVVGRQHELVAVTTGLFDDRGLVEVAGGGLREGMLVEVPQ